MAKLASSPCTTSILCGCLAFAFPTVPHFNNRYLRVTCSPSRTSTATSTVTSTTKLLDKTICNPRPGIDLALAPKGQRDIKVSKTALKNTQKDESAWSFFKKILKDITQPSYNNFWEFLGRWGGAPI